MGFNKKTLVSIAVQLLTALMIAIPVALNQGFALDGAAYMNFCCLSDGFFVSAVLFVGMGGLFWVSTTGFFDIFSYAFQSLFVLFSPLKKVREFPHYYEYKCEKDAKREGKPITHTVLVVGLICLALSVICLVLYYNLPVPDPVGALAAY